MVQLNLISMIKIIVGVIFLTIGGIYYFPQDGNIDNKNYQLQNAEYHAIFLNTVNPMAIGVNAGADTVTAINNTKDTIFVYPINVE